LFCNFIERRNFRRWFNKNSVEITVSRLLKQVYHWLKKDGLPEIAHKIVEDLKWDFNVGYDEKDAVGRYRRQDALGTPFCITVDHQTIEDQTVTIRHRDTMKQDQVKISDLNSIIENEVSMKNWLMKCNFFVYKKAFQFGKPFVSEVKFV
jgi:glycyl-tRNA synthetase (class II)